MFRMSPKYIFLCRRCKPESLKKHSTEIHPWVCNILPQTRSYALEFMKQIIYVYLHDNDLSYIALLNPSWKYFMLWLVILSVGQVIAKLQCRNDFYVLVFYFMTGKFWK